MHRYINTMTQFVTEANRQRLATNGTNIEICPSSPVCWMLWNSLRGTFNYWATGGLSVGGGVALNIGLDPYPPTTDSSYSRWVGSMLHEYMHSEDGTFFPSGQRPVGKESYSEINQWPEVIALQNDCQANGADPGALGGHMCTSFRVPQRLEAVFGTTNKANCRTATTGNISLSGIPASNYTANISVVVGDRVLVRTQDNATQNGIYVASSGAWSRSTDADTGAKLVAGLRCQITSGDLANRWFALFVLGTVTLDTTPICFHQDVMLNSAGPGSTGGTPQSRVDRWLQMCSNNGFFI